MTAIELPASATPVDPPPRLPRIDIMGQRIDCVTEQEAVAFILGQLAQGKGGWAVTPNVDHVRRTTRDSRFASLLGMANLSLCDGMPLVWASHLQGTPLPERVSGSDIIWSLSKAAARAGVSIYFLGGNPGAAAKASRVLKLKNPRLAIAGVECPPVGFENDNAYMDALIERLKTSQPGIVFVALGSPKQEELIERIRSILPNAWWIGVGISFSFISGEVKRAPVWMRRRGLEWMHRLIQEPRRLARRYLIDDLPFVFRLLYLSLRDGVAGRAHMQAVDSAGQTIETGSGGLSRGIYGWAICLALVLLAHIPLLAYASLRLWGREAYQFFPIAWAAALLLAFSRLRRAKTGTPHLTTSTFFLGVGILILGFATLSWTWSLALIALPLNIAALVLAVGGLPMLRALAPALVLFLTTIPPPFGTDAAMLNSLRQVAVQWSGKILDAIGVLHVISGNLIDIPGHRLFVAEACSGINSTISSFAFAVGCAVFLRRGVIHTTLLALLAILFAIAGNILRIAGGAALIQWYNFDIINGWRHETAGLAIFAFCVVLILSADQLLHYFLRPVRPMQIARRTASFPWPRIAWTTRSLAACAFAAAVAGVFLVAPNVTWSAPIWARGHLPENAQFSLPDHMGAWSRSDLPIDLKAETEGVKSQFWPMSNGSLYVLVAMDYPFPEYHDLPYCYQVQGWTLASRTSVSDSLGPIEEAELSRTAGDASLFFALYDERGRWLVASQDQSVSQNLLRRLTTLKRAEIDSQPSYQMQILVHHNKPLTNEERGQIQALFRDVRTELSHQVAAQLPKHP